MSRLSSSFIPAILLILGLASGTGCGPGGDEAAAEHKLHNTQGFSKEQLNAPLSAQAKARGAQVPPPPVRP
jgi:hypothetical protein